MTSQSEVIAPKEWYADEACGDQACIVDQQTGKNIAVAYDKADGPLLASAPELLAELEYALSILESMDKPLRNTLEDILDEKIDFNRIRYAISKAEGR